MMTPDEKLEIVASIMNEAITNIINISYNDLDEICREEFGFEPTLEDFAAIRTDLEEVVENLVW